jgi:hypothetical protein
MAFNQLGLLHLAILIAFPPGRTVWQPERRCARSCREITLLIAVRNGRAILAVTAAATLPIKEISSTQRVSLIAFNRRGVCVTTGLAG